MKEWLEQFMAGRYGTDELAKYSLILAAAAAVINVFFRIPALNMLVLILFLWIYYRIFSRKIEKRSAENRAFLEARNRFFGYFRKKSMLAKDLKTHHIYRCPNCSQKIRVPRGRGRICITCPKCGNEFIKKS